MSIFKTKALLLAFSIFVLFSCSDDDDNLCTDQVIETTGLESEYNCVNTKFEMDIDLTDDFIIITNQADFDSRVTGECQPDIDFSTYNLLIGKEQLTTGNDSIDYVLTEDCDTNTYHLEVTFNQNETFIAPKLTYHRLLPKGSQTRDVSVDITID